MDYELPIELLEMARGLMDTYENAYQSLKPVVFSIIKDRVKKIDYIEHVLDSLLDLPTEKAYKLFVVLCDYVETFNKEVAADYLNIYKELYGDDFQEQENSIKY